MQKMNLRDLIKQQKVKLTKEEKKLLDQYEVELIFPTSIEEVAKKKAEALADIVYENLGPINSKKLYEIVENS